MTDRLSASVDQHSACPVMRLLSPDEAPHKGPGLGIAVHLPQGLGQVEGGLVHLRGVCRLTHASRVGGESRGISTNAGHRRCAQLTPEPRRTTWEDLMLIVFLMTYWPGGTSTAIGMPGFATRSASSIAAWNAAVSSAGRWGGCCCGGCWVERRALSGACRTGLRSPAALRAELPACKLCCHSSPPPPRACVVSAVCSVLYHIKRDGVVRDGLGAACSAAAGRGASLREVSGRVQGGEAPAAAKHRSGGQRGEGAPI